MATIFGWDASHYDTVAGDTAEKALREGFSFVTHKAGGDKDDPELAAWWKEFKPHRDKILLGAYWVLYPREATLRADKFLARLDSQCPGWRDGPFILQLDCERWNGDVNTQPYKSDIAAACDWLKAHVPKLTPIVYASAGQYGNGLKGLRYPLWNARYPTDVAGPASVIYYHVGGDTGSGWHAYSGQTPAIWQFTSSATIAGQTTSDGNAFRGKLADLVKLVAPGWAPKEDPMPTAQEVADALLDTPIGNENYPHRTVRQVIQDLSNLRDALVDIHITLDEADVDVAAPLARIIAAADAVNDAKKAQDAEEASGA